MKSGATLSLSLSFHRLESSTKEYYPSLESSKSVLHSIHCISFLWERPKVPYVGSPLLMLDCIKLPRIEFHAAICFSQGCSHINEIHARNSILYHVNLSNSPYPIFSNHSLKVCLVLLYIGNNCVPWNSFT
ncbi:hypothetical protein LguiA_001983 [Lonicera macranthoides]